MFKRTLIVVAVISTMAGGYCLPDFIAWTKNIVLQSSRPSLSRGLASTSEQAGESLVMNGIDSKGKALAAVGFGESELMGPQLACKNCHGGIFQGQSEGSYHAPAIAWSDLVRASKAKGITIFNLLKLATNTGIGMDGRVLNSVMPKFRLSDSDIDNLLHWFKAKDHWLEYGDDGAEIKIALLSQNHDAAVKLADGLSEYFSERPIHGRKLVFVPAEGTVAIQKDKFFAALGDVSFAGEQNIVTPTFVVEDRRSSAAIEAGELFRLLRSQEEWRSMRQRVAAVATEDAPVMCNGRDVVSILRVSDRLRCVKLLAREREQSQVEIVARWIEWLPHELGFPDAPDGIDVSMWVNYVMLAKIVHGALANAATPPSQERMRDVLESGQKIEIGSGVASKFTPGDRIGLDGEFVLRWDAAAQEFETIWRPF